MKSLKNQDYKIKRYPYWVPFLIKDGLLKSYLLQTNYQIDIIIKDTSFGKLRKNKEVRWIS